MSRIQKVRTNDEALALQLLGEADLVARRALHELDIGDAVTNLDEGGGRGVERAGSGSQAADRGGRKAAGGEHGVELVEGAQ